MSIHSVFFKNWSITTYHVGNGSKQIGLAVWWNSVRKGLQVNVGIVEIQIMHEKG